MIGKITTLRLLCDCCRGIIADNYDDYDEQHPRHITEDQMLREALENGWAHLCGQEILCEECYADRCEKKADKLDRSRTFSLRIEATLPDIPDATDDQAREYLRYCLGCGGCLGTNPFFSADVPPQLSTTEITSIPPQPCA